MSDTTRTAQERYLVVRNHEEQYSLWRADRELPLGWDPVGEPGSREACLERIEELWTDMRPLSLRTFMEEQQHA
ncbi:MbtH family protein [Streptomyces sp. NPDC012389]|uniref:MbtH family protein n=1 Tax=unclassified Streptomyces TaxID=2593676 RepID=UPI00081E291A|nr:MULTISPECIES: MbtH family NRPS accessory protein [unclassified Streptomyces]MYR95873.1 MbtH family NRPS accessory protein [Streptomyces sp. SID4937]MYX14341.1 MbtH family NRPS accessory protein [Streptomyces sp. SID8374]SCD98889.1 MbtH protein [Streptomyces sp. ScaeMP-e83]